MEKTWEGHEVCPRRNQFVEEKKKKLFPNWNVNKHDISVFGFSLFHYLTENLLRFRWIFKKFFWIGEGQSTLFFNAHTTRGRTSRQRKDAIVCSEIHHRNTSKTDLKYEVKPKFNNRNPSDEKRTLVDSLVTPWDRPLHNFDTKNNFSFNKYGRNLQYLGSMHSTGLENPFLFDKNTVYDILAHSPPNRAINKEKKNQKQSGHRHQSN